MIENTRNFITERGSNNIVNPREGLNDVNFDWLSKAFSLTADGATFHLIG
jgi:hypothetical protein